LTKEEAMRYVHDYESAHSSNMVNVRTAERNAGFFLPHLRAGMSVLDVGCGAGSITVGFAQVVSPGEVVGAEIDEGQVKLGNERASQMRLDNVRFEKGDIQDLPYPDNTFDAAFAHAVIEHVDRPQHAVGEMLRVVKPGGFIGIRTTAAGGILFTPMTDALRRTWEVYLRFRQHNGGDPFIGAHLKALLREAGAASVIWSASYDIWSTPEAVRSFMDVHMVEMAGPRIVEQVTGLGWVGPEHFEAAEAAIREWGESPDAIFAVSMGEAIGWKA
jgi:ubiquinone/menaquinone biosynthesis C-methylase UbiE